MPIETAGGLASMSGKNHPDLRAIRKDAERTNRVDITIQGRILKKDIF
jgi:hypothetical protein